MIYWTRNRIYLLQTTLLLLALALLTACTLSRNEPAAPTVANTAPAPTPTPTRLSAAALPDLGPAPPIANEVWLNVDQPPDLASLRGRVVLVEFWTFGCINCQRVIPAIREWHERYAGDDFAVVSVHYPEFSYEEDVENIRVAAARLGVDYPIAVDNDGATWRAYGQRFWPTLYLLDKRGHIRYKHIGEGAYAETEAVIQALMAEPDPPSG